ncbi:sugar phosphate isomerase/epimerase family protein [Kocuria sp. M1R5S2]|uniref:sugar phosphate isomerase/epimerase family protein n=1 Tax=Kocuria rhizosphaerae TaxID=3376285 RepID=UPI003795929E
MTSPPAPAGRPPLGLAQLSLVGTAPPDLVLVAAEAGFDFIGARVRPVTPAERPYDLSPGSPMLRDALARMRDTGVAVRDIEFLLLDGTDQREAWLAMMEAGHALGAGSLTVACADEDTARATDTLARMTEDGRGFGIVPTLEPISYQAVRSVPAAAELARRAGCRIVLDALHFRRSGGTPEQLREHADVVEMLQLCDGPAQRPATRQDLVHESRAERGIPGEGEFDLPALVAAFGPDVPLSVETPSERHLAELGEQGWARRLHDAAQAVLARAEDLRGTA